ncbi:LUD domain-containing protein [Chitinophaga sedimenti]|uniref:LutC/YkgG family protein n=1 Tax=Chitinophaga sedimenti TaxID=2033606 RepID=UPI0020033DE8|nr:LUD domain-containing protein [Chitinophaga sedimenti]MCK7554378.1 LUD domain-containing protein [Chitinophaga sedimenti]
MSSRERILSAVKKNQPELTELVAYIQPESQEDLLGRFTSVLEGIGGTAIVAQDLAGVKSYLKEMWQGKGRIVSMIPELQELGELAGEADPHNFENVELAIIPAHFAVAENSAVWVTEELLQQRVLPFITQNLAVVVSKARLVATMHHAYDIIGSGDYGFGTFIAGPSKTADIEQSLVLGAHGSKSMTVFLI